MRHFPVDFHTGQGGRNGLERDRPERHDGRRADLKPMQPTGSGRWPALPFRRPAGRAVRAGLACGRPSTRSGPFPGRDAGGARFPGALRRCIGPEPFPRLAPRGDSGTDADRSAPSRARPGPPGGAGGGRGDGRAFGMRRRKADQGREAPRRGGRGRVPGRDRRPRAPGAGPGRRAGGGPRHAGKAPAGEEAAGGRRLRGAEAGGRAEGARPRTGHRDRPETEGNRGLHGPCRRRAVERAFAWMPRRRRLAEDCGRTLASSLARARPAACQFLMRRMARG